MRQETWGSRWSAAAVLGIAIALAAPAAAQAWEVRITITGAGQVTETTPANLVGSDCVTSAANPTGSVGKTCLAGTPEGPYGHLWDVDYVATPKSGYSFVRWESDGTTRSPVICDRSSPPATTSTYTGAICKFRTPDNLQTRAVFADTTNPVMSSLTGPNAPVNGPATFHFSAQSDPTFRYFECRVAGVHDWQTCTSGGTENPPTSGEYTFEVRAVDWSNNRSSALTKNWTVDKVAPQTTLDSGTGPSEGGFVSSTSATFQFTTNESGGFVCSLDGTETSCGSPKAYSGLGQGPHTFSVRAVDTAGNADATPATRSWTVDTVAPETTLDPAVGPAEGATVASRSASFSFFSNETAGSFVCNLDGQVRSCSSPITGLADGTHTFAVHAVDRASNPDPTPATRTWTVDGTPPGSSILTGPPKRTKKRRATFTFGATEAGATFECRLDSKPFVACPATKSFRVKPGKHKVQVRALDALGNRDATPATRAWKVLRRR